MAPSSVTSFMALLPQHFTVPFAIVRWAVPGVTWPAENKNAVEKTPTAISDPKK